MFSYTASFDGGEPRCPANFRRGAYARGIQQERARAAVTVTAAAFSPCGGYLVCASDSGRLAVWELARQQQQQQEQKAMDTGHEAEEVFSAGEDTRLDTTPDMSWQADRSCINCLVFAGHLLLCGGDDSLFGCPWSAIVSALEEGRRPPLSCSSSSSAQDTGGSGVLRVRCPPGGEGGGTAAGRNGARKPEINDVKFDETAGSVLCAAGDGNAYEWDLGSITATATPVRTYGSGNGSYLHAVASAPGSSVVATGSDSGHLGVWDKRAKSGAASRGANVALLRPAHAQTGDGKGSSPRSGGRGDVDGAECVTSLEMDADGQTLLCAGRRTGGVAVAGGMLEPAVGRGWVNQWSLAAGIEATSVASLPAEVQCMCSAEQGQALVVAGAESSVTFLDRSSSKLERKTRTSVTPGSVYALAVSSSGRFEGATCVAGSGPRVDVFTPSPAALSLSLCFV
ncbi:unnamed protein product [Scytosiphon promiscuus]